MCGIKFWKAYEYLRRVYKKKLRSNVGYTFEISIKRRIFLSLIRHIQRKKIFISYFLWTKKSKMQATTKYFVNGFL